jgi:hypothetical protein
MLTTATAPGKGPAGEVRARRCIRPTAADVAALAVTARAALTEQDVKIRLGGTFMRSALLFGGLLVVALTAAASADDKEKKGTKVEVGGMTSTTPADWVKQEPKKSVIQRAYQFGVPKADGDKKDAEVVIFEGLGGTWEQNAERWKGFFKAPKGKSIDDVAKESKVKVGTAEGNMLDVSGTFTGPKFDPTFAGTHEDFRLIAIQVKAGDTTYQIKFHGPAKTVEKHKKDFDKWIKDFKK